MASKLDTFTDSNRNGKDPRITGGQFSDADPVGNSFPNSPNNNAGDGLRKGLQFQDAADQYSLDGFNIIDSSDPDYAGRASSTTWERTSVDVSKADRGRES